jgi:hypothetical protein
MTKHRTTKLYTASTAPALPLAVQRGVISFITPGRKTSSQHQADDWVLETAGLDMVKTEL